jgi:hypothetical protein
MNLNLLPKRLDRLERDVAELKRRLDAAKPGDVVPIPAGVATQQAADLLHRRASGRPPKVRDDG